MINFEVIAGILTAYLLGSIPTAVIVGKVFYGIDIRTVGSGNAGATNTIRTLGMKAGIPVLLFDVFKSFAAVNLSLFLTSALFSPNQLEIYKIILGSAAVLGHVFPVFASFKGGKGVATIVGMLIALYPMTFLVILGCFILLMIFTKIVSVSSIVCSILFPLIEVFIFHETRPPLVVLAVTVAIFIPYTHRENIKRLMAGTEKKFDFGRNKIVKH
ncbi:MAG TPA: glycerol-3-phosphate 1-O-acyltransferase PlsY [Lentimicrobium sp.]|nr:glycerol-3-phosphate 1-O-acyltransferase PlsY [Lentimicrobium sp.]